MLFSSFSYAWEEVQYNLLLSADLQSHSRYTLYQHKEWHHSEALTHNISRLHRLSVLGHHQMDLQSIKIAFLAGLIASKLFLGVNP